MCSKFAILIVATRFPSACLSEQITSLRYGFEIVVKRNNTHVARRLILLVELRRGRMARNLRVLRYSTALTWSLLLYRHLLGLILLVNAGRFSLVAKPSALGFLRLDFSFHRVLVDNERCLDWDDLIRYFLEVGLPLESSTLADTSLFLLTHRLQYLSRILVIKIGQRRV